MSGRIAEHLRQNVVGYIAIFLFVAGGTAYAVDGPNPGQNTIGSEDIIGNEVKSDDIGNGRIFNLDIADDIIQGGKIKDNTLTGADIDESSLSGLAQGLTSFEQVEIPPGTGSVNFHNISDRVIIYYHCPSAPDVNDGAVGLVNATDGTMSLYLDRGLADPTHTSLPSFGATSVNPTKSGDRVTFSFTSIHGGDEIFGTAIVNSRQTAGGCFAQSQALLNR